MKYSLNQLKSKIESGSCPDYILFWGHTQKLPGITDNSSFSQWWPSPFTVDEITYPTAEHWMMAKKALLFGDAENFNLILKAHKPAIAKALGRAVKNFDAAIWSSKAYELVVEGNQYKFSQDESLKNYLLGTGNKVLVEASPFDTVWGIGLSKNDEKAKDPFKWKGTNLLGFALMEVRDRIKKQEWKNN